MDEQREITFRKDSSLLSTLQNCIHDESELRLVISSLVLQKVNERLESDPKLYAIFCLADMILAYEDFCEGGTTLL